MDIRKLALQTAEYGYQSVASGLSVAGSGVGYVTGFVGNLRIFGSTATANSEQLHDERHYFLVFDPRNEDGYSLVVTRCLPEGVPPINDLPKRRILHLPHPEADAMLRSILIRQAQAEELAKPAQGKSLADRAREMADLIDTLDGRVFGGVLLIGGLVAIFNPVAGAAIAAKSLIPSLGILASKYGLRVAEESLNQADISRKAKQAEQDVLSQFKGSHTQQNVNPVLEITDRALRTSEEEFDPMLEMHAVLQATHSGEERRRIQLAVAAVLDVFATVLDSPTEPMQIGFGPEDIRFLRLLKSIS